MAKAKKEIAEKRTSRSKPVAKAASAPGKAAPVKPCISEVDRKKLTSLLLNLREDLTGQVANLKNGSLRRDDEVNTVEDGTDAFDRQFALSLASSEQEAVVQVNDALRRLSDGTYGSCEVCQKGIEKARLEALPFVRTCIACQSEIERRNVKVRPNLQPAEQQEGWDESRTPTAEAEEEA